MLCYVMLCYVTVTEFAVLKNVSPHEKCTLTQTSKDFET